MKNLDIFLIVLLAVIVCAYFYHKYGENFSPLSFKPKCGDNTHDSSLIISCPAQCPKPEKIQGGTRCVEVKKYDPNAIIGSCGDNPHGSKVNIICPDDCKYKKTYIGGTTCNANKPELVAK